MPKKQKTFEEIMQRKRLDARLGLRELADRVGISYGSLYLVEGGTLTWRGLRTAFKLKDELKISDADFLAGLRKSVEQLHGKSLMRNLGKEEKPKRKSLRRKAA